MSPPQEEFDDEVYVDVRSLPLKPPQRLIPPAAPARRPWHPVMWDNSIAGMPEQTNTDQSDERHTTRGGEYPHKQRMRNLRRLIAEGKVKPTAETLIFFLCNKFAASEERHND